MKSVSLMKLGGKDCTIIFKIKDNVVHVISSDPNNPNINIYSRPSESNYLIKHNGSGLILNFHFTRTKDGWLCSVSRETDLKHIEYNDNLAFKINSKRDIYVTLNILHDESFKTDVCDLSWGYNKDEKYEIIGLSDLYFEV